MLLTIIMLLVIMILSKLVMPELTKLAVLVLEFLSSQFFLNFIGMLAGLGVLWAIFAFTH